MALIGLLAVPSLCVAGTEYVTFAAFYRDPGTFAWTLYGIGALVVGALVLVAFLPTTPVIAALGTWIGTSYFGLAGVAATNAGLALLGGGSVASGGFGVLGGAAILAAALSFSTDVVFDYTLSSAIEKYEHSKFIEASAKMMTLPLPRNADGPKSYKAAVKVLQDSKYVAIWTLIKKGQVTAAYNTTFSNAPRKDQGQLVKEALEAIKSFDGESLSPAEESRKLTLTALLHFLDNDYEHAREVSDLAHQKGLSANEVTTLPAFIYAVGCLYMPIPDMNASMRSFMYAIASEPENPLTPLLFAVYLDRLTYRTNDGAVKLTVLDDLQTFSNSLARDDRQVAIQQGLLMRYFMRLKLEQQEIESLSQSASKTIRDAPETLKVVKTSMAEYNRILLKSRSALDDQERSWIAESVAPRPLLPTVVGPSASDKLRDWRLQFDKEVALHKQYDQDKGRLLVLVEELEKYQYDQVPWLTRVFRNLGIGE